MYPVEFSGEWAGLRRIHFRSWLLFYVWWAQDQTVYIEAIVNARRRSE
jgi:hypothetical protein